MATPMETKLSSSSAPAQPPSHDKPEATAVLVKVSEDKYDPFVYYFKETIQFYHTKGLHVADAFQLAHATCVALATSMGILMPMIQVKAVSGYKCKEISYINVYGNAIRDFARGTIPEGVAHEVFVGMDRHPFPDSAEAPSVAFDEFTWAFLQENFATQFEVWKRSGKGDADAFDIALASSVAMAKAVGIPTPSMKGSVVIRLAAEAKVSVPNMYGLILQRYHKITPKICRGVPQFPELNVADAIGDWSAMPAEPVAADVPTKGALVDAPPSVAPTP